MIRVLHSVSNMDRAGIETMIMNYYRNIDRSKIQFDFLCNKAKIGAYDDEIKKMGGRIFRTPGLNPIKWFKYEHYVMDLLKREKDIKIVHSHNGAFSLQAQIAAKKSGIKNRIVHVHGTRIDINCKLPLKLLYKKFLKKNCNRYWGCGTEAIEYYFGKAVIKNNNYMLIRNAIEIDKFIYNEEKRKEIREKYNLSDKFVVGNVARFMKQKNHKFTIELFNEILKIEPKSVLMLVGDGELQKKIKEEVKNMKIVDRVIFVGNVSNVNELYNAMDVFLLPSLFEGLPVVGIEAQASGLKCFFSNTITKEVKITNNVKFLDLKKDTLKQWASEIVKCQNYKRLNMKNEIVEAGYSIKDEADKLQEIYLKMGEE